MHRFLPMLALAFAVMVPPVQANEKNVEEGRALAFDRKKGNCLSCHMIPGGQAPGGISVPLVAMKSRFPDKAVLRSHVWNQPRFRPHAMMPPFGKHRILSEGEIDKIVDFLHTL